MNRYEGFPKTGSEVNEMLKRIERQRKIKKFIGLVINIVAIYFTCSIYDWKLAVIIIAFIYGNNLERSK